MINNDVLFFKIYKGFAVDNAKSVVLMEDIRDYFAKKNGLDLTKFFTQYLFNHKVPTFEFFQKKGEFYFRWTETISGFDMPVNLLVNKKEVRVYSTA